MTIQSLLVLLSCSMMSVAGIASAQDKPSSQILGRWEVVSVDRDGDHQHGEIGQEPGDVITIKYQDAPYAPDITMFWGSRKERAVSTTTTVERLDFEGSPHEIDFKTQKNGSATQQTMDPTAKAADTAVSNSPPQIGKGIFERSGEQLRYCVAAPGQPRPTQFLAPKGSGYTLVTLKVFKTGER